MKTAREALSQHLGMDWSELPEYRYKSSKFNKPVYALESGYYCASKKSTGLPISEDMILDWKEVTDVFVNSWGWRIFKATETIE